jgi:hypothetical protein
VRVSLAKTDPLMRPGLSVRVEVVRASWPRGLSVPRGAVRFEKDGPVVRRAGSGASGAGGGSSSLSSRPPSSCSPCAPRAPTPGRRSR